MPHDEDKKWSTATPFHRALYGDGHGAALARAVHGLKSLRPADVPNPYTQRFSIDGKDHREQSGWWLWGWRDAANGVNRNAEVANVS